MPDERTAGSYQKVERKVGDFATAAAAGQVSLNIDGTSRRAGCARWARGPCAVRVEEAERLLAGQKPTRDVIRAAADAAASNTRRIWLVFSSPEVCIKPSRGWGGMRESEREGQRGFLRAGRRTAHPAR